MGERDWVTTKMAAFESNLRLMDMALGLGGLLPSGVGMYRHKSVLTLGGKCGATTCSPKLLRSEYLVRVPKNPLRFPSLTHDGTSGGFSFPP
jgi:hypothetical protein